MTSSSPVDHHRSKFIFAFVVLALVITIALWLFFNRKSVETNDAFIDGHIHPISSRVAGTVVWVNPDVEDTHLIQQGTLLARLDPDDYSPTVQHMSSEVAKDEAELQEAQNAVIVTSDQAEGRRNLALAAISQAKAEIAHNQANLTAAQAQVETLESEALRSKQDLQRFTPLLQAHEISRSEFDRRRQEADSARHRVEEAKAMVNAAQQSVASAEETMRQREADLHAASPVAQIVNSAQARVRSLQGELGVSQASLRRANLDLSYTQLLAPVTGIVGKKDIEKGQHLSAGDTVLAISALDDIWVTAYFRETQLRHVAIGDSASISIDSTGDTLTGNVESIGGATGSRFSPLPPENATGNFVKVVQRVPVRIRFHDSASHRGILVPGMSVEATIHGAH